MITSDIWLDDTDGDDDNDDNDDDNDDNDDVGEIRPPVPSDMDFSGFNAEDYTASLEAIARDIQKRSKFYKSSRMTDEDEHLDLQGIEDAKIFRAWVEVCVCQVVLHLLIRLSPQIGSEFDVLTVLLDKIGARNAQIFSAFSMDCIRGSIYVEAKGLPDVQQALRGISSVLHARGAPRTELVSQDDCGSLFKMMSRENTNPVEPSSWVRIKKKGRLNGKLALVKSLDIRNGLAVVCLPSEVLPNRKLKRKRGAVSPSDLKSQIQDKTIKLADISIDGVNALPRELTLFKQSGDEFVKRALATDHVYLQTEDRVLFVSGPLRGLEGYVSEIHGDGTISFVSTLTPEAIRVSTFELCRKFIPGDDVTVLDGKHKGLRGFITAIKGGVALVYVPNMEEVG
jgi:ribosomal protein L24